ncbi:hypothetical protein ACEN2P_21265 [Pedobacter psychrotolerans]|uniref:hypothetical protein n=1 Tax=Pedobacter psychrotolerans TaxID=1843235 RepID=UPI003F9C276E
MLHRLKKPPRNDDLTNDPHPAINTTLSVPRYPAWQIFAGKSTKIYALPLITPQPKAASKRER